MDLLEDLSYIQRKAWLHREAEIRYLYFLMKDGFKDAHNCVKNALFNEFGFLLYYFERNSSTIAHVYAPKKDVRRDPKRKQQLAICVFILSSKNGQGWSYTSTYWKKESPGSHTEGMYGIVCHT